MKIKVFTTFPEMIRPIVSQSILGRAVENGLLAVEAIDIREYAENKHRNTDDYPFGGGAGMVMLAQPIVSAFRAHLGPDFRGQAHLSFAQGRAVYPEEGRGTGGRKRAGAALRAL